jgi:hypothetical protein
MGNFTVWLDCDGANEQRMDLYSDDAESAKDQYMKTRFPILWQSRKLKIAEFRMLLSCLRAEDAIVVH